MILHTSLSLSDNEGPEYPQHEHVSHHRYPVHWTGDGVPLIASIESMIDQGVNDFKCYVHSGVEQSECITILGLFFQTRLAFIPKTAAATTAAVDRTWCAGLSTAPLAPLPACTAVSTSHGRTTITPRTPSAHI